MSKQLRCAQCGMVLTAALKAIPQTGSVITVVFPHECLEDGEIVDFSLPARVKTPEERVSDRDELMQFPFVKNLNALTAASAKPTLDVEHPHMQDRRPGRDEVVSSTAPEGIHGMLGIGKAPQTSSEPRNKQLDFDFLRDEGGEMDG